MTVTLAPPPSTVPELLGRSSTRTAGLTFVGWTDRLIKRRGEFGITRVSSITRLDRVGFPVVQVARPLALSNSVSQGKGQTWTEAAASAFMEAVENWAGENIPEDRSHQASLNDVGPVARDLYNGCAVNGAPEAWEFESMRWLFGWDLFTARARPVPLALVDTVYTLPSPHRAIFPRTTTGLGAGRSFVQAVVQAGLEVLERDAIAQADRTPHFFDAHQVALPVGLGGLCSDLLSRVADADLLVGLWKAPTAHSLPVYWCHLMEAESAHELVPLPSEGFGCDLAHERALAKAILEACQARAAAISAAREDITRLLYPREYDRAHLAQWRHRLVSPRQTRPIPFHEEQSAVPDEACLEKLLEALRLAGAKAAIVVPLLADEENEVYVTRVLAPPLSMNPRA